MFDAQHGRFGAQIRTLKYKYCYLWTQRTDSEVWNQSAQSGKPWKSLRSSSDDNRLPLTAFTAGNLTFHSRKTACCLFAKAEKNELKMVKTTPVWLIFPGVSNLKKSIKTKINQALNVFSETTQGDKRINTLQSRLSKVGFRRSSVSSCVCLSGPTHVLSQSLSLTDRHRAVPHNTTAVQPPSDRRFIKSFSGPRDSPRHSQRSLRLMLLDPAVSVTA